MEFVSLNTLIEDLMQIIRGSKVSDSEKISKRQVEDWIHQYRALLLRNELSSGDFVNPDYVQTIASIKLVPVNSADEGALVETDTVFYRSEQRLPKTVNLRQASGITYIGTLDKKRIQLVPGHRAEFQLYKRFTPTKPVAYIEDQYLYVVNPNGLKYVTVRGIFEIPTEVYEYADSSNTDKYWDLSTTKYPIPTTLLPALKQMIIEKELGIIAVAPADVVNDSNPELTNNVQSR